MLPEEAMGMLEAARAARRLRDPGWRDSARGGGAGKEVILSGIASLPQQRFKSAAPGAMVVQRVWMS